MSGQDLFSVKAVKDDVAWITKCLFCSRLDKAANTCCFLCIRHIRLMAAERLSGPDFRPCKEDGTWILRSHILLKIGNDFHDLLPELVIQYEALLYLMATFKQHKGKYRWFTNAFHTSYFGIAHLLTIVTMLILEYFMQVKTSLFWLINLVIEVIFNLLESIIDISIADVTRCYESILQEGEDNLLDVIKHLILLGFKQKLRLTFVPLLKFRLWWIKKDRWYIPSRPPLSLKAIGLN